MDAARGEFAVLHHLFHQEHGILGGKMRYKFLVAVFVLFCIPLSAQIATKTGTIYGRVTDDKQAPLPGVSVALQSNVIVSQSATTGGAGTFRFASLPPGNYIASFTLSGFTEVRQEDIQVSTGGNVDLQVIMKPSLEEILSVSAETSPVDRVNNSNTIKYTREYLDHVPNGRDPWLLISMSSAVDWSVFNTGFQQPSQLPFYSRGGSSRNNVWNYDGVNFTPIEPILSTTFYDFDSFEEVQISTGGNDSSIQTGGVVINLVTKRAGNRWQAQGSYYFVDDNLQSDNTPQELKKNPLINPDTHLPAKGSNRIDEIQEIGFNAGGPIIKDKLFLWGGYRKSKVDLFSVNDQADQTDLTIYNIKLNYNWDSHNETQTGYFKALKDKNFALYPSQQAPETFWKQENTPLQGIWTIQHTWIPNDQLLANGRFGYIGDGSKAIPNGGVDVPIIYLSAIHRWENTFYVFGSEQPAKDVNVDVDYFKENFFQGDHEFKFGFEYKSIDQRIFSSYGNGQLINDSGQTVPGGPLTSGEILAQLVVDGKANLNRASFYLTDTFRKDRLTLNLGFRFDHQTGVNEASGVPAVPGFEEFVGSFDYAGGDPGIVFNNISPRLGATYDLTGDGRTIIRANFARYYDAFDHRLLAFSNPTFDYHGASFTYTNRNGDRSITPDEITSSPDYYGLTGGVFDLNQFLAKRKYDPGLTDSWSNELILGFEREVVKDLSIAATFTYRKYGDLLTIVPAGISTADYQPAEEDFHIETPLGNFTIPYFVLPPSFVYDGSAIFMNIKDYTQHYKGVDFVVRKRMSHSFLLNGSLTLQRQTGHYDGGDSLAFQIAAWDSRVKKESFAFDPTNLPFLQNQPYAYTGSLVKPQVYPYAEWSLKIGGVYQFPANISTGAFLRYQQGYPFVLFGTIDDSSLKELYLTSLRAILLEPVGSRRFDNIFTLDLKIEKDFELQNLGRITAIVDILNITNANTVLFRNRNVGSQSLNQIEEVLSPRAFRLGFRYAF
jgi:hypothetical protein